MIKSITLAYRKPGMSHEEFCKYWQEQHGPLAAKMIPGLRKYVQNHALILPGSQYEGDGLVEMWFDSLEDQKKSFEFIMSPAGRPLMEDGQKFCGSGPTKGAGAWIVEEHVIKDDLKKK
jgi:uncharacterized protein (TIGR02118 family)